MMEAARTSETLVQLYQTTLCYNPEDSHLHTHRRQNLKSYLGKFMSLNIKSTKDVHTELAGIFEQEILFIAWKVLW
jgi:hypothetical protein